MNKPTIVDQQWVVNLTQDGKDAKVVYKPVEVSDPLSVSIPPEKIDVTNLWAATPFWTKDDVVDPRFEPRMIVAEECEDKAVECNECEREYNEMMKDEEDE